MPFPPWANSRTSISGEDFEGEVAAVLRAVGKEFPGLAVERQERISTPEGVFRFDVTARFRSLGVDFLVLIECKDHARPVEREDIQVLADRMRAVRAQKGILFSTNGFQKGAVEFAMANHIALVRLIDGALTYETRSAVARGGVRASLPGWADIPRFAGQLVTLSERDTWVMTSVDRSRATALVTFLCASA